MCEAASAFLNSLNSTVHKATSTPAVFSTGTPSGVYVWVLRVYVTLLQRTFSLLSSFIFCFVRPLHFSTPQHAPSNLSIHLSFTPIESTNTLGHVRLHILKRGSPHEKKLNVAFPRWPDLRKHARHPIIIQTAICDSNPQLYDISVTDESPLGLKVV